MCLIINSFIRKKKALKKRATIGEIGSGLGSILQLNPTTKKENLLKGILVNGYHSRRGKYIKTRVSLSLLLSPKPQLLQLTYSFRGASPCFDLPTVCTILASTSHLITRVSLVLPSSEFFFYLGSNLHRFSHDLFVFHGFILFNMIFGC